MKRASKVFVSGAAGLLLCSCGGGDGSSSGTIVSVGGAEGQVADILQRKFNVQLGGDGGLGSAKLILIDGDHVSGPMLAGMNGLKAAVDKGVPVLAVDADQDLKAAIAEQVGAPLSPGGLSLACVYKKVDSPDGSFFRVLEIPGGTDRIESTTYEVKDGTVIGHSESTERDKTATATSVDHLLKALENSGYKHWGPKPPTGAPAFYTTLQLIDGSEYSTLNGQYSGRDIAYTFMGILRDKFGGGYQQQLFLTMDADFITGPLKGGGFNDNVLTIGWFQDQVRLEESVPSQTSEDENIDGFWSAAYGNEMSSFMFFHDRNGFQWPYEYHDSIFNDLDRWTSYSVDYNVMDQTFYQTDPYDPQKGNFGDGWESSNPPRNKEFPAASIGTRNVGALGYLFLHDPIHGVLRLNYKSTKWFAKLGQQYFIQGGFFEPIPTGRVEITDGSQKFVMLDFGKIAPPGAAPQKK